MDRVWMRLDEISFAELKALSSANNDSAGFKSIEKLNFKQRKQICSTLKPVILQAWCYV